MSDTKSDRVEQCFGWWDGMRWHLPPRGDLIDPFEPTVILPAAQYDADQAVIKAVEKYFYNESADELPALREAHTLRKMLADNAVNNLEDEG